MLIRPATQVDWPDILSALRPAVRAGESFALPQDADDAAIRAYWTGRDSNIFVAEVEGAVVGSSYVRANQLGPGSHVANAGYVVAPSHGGRGIARGLCAHSLEAARSQGFRAMQFNFVVSTNVAAVHLWQQMGFAVVGTLQGAFRHPSLGFVDALVMMQSLVSEAPALQPVGT